MESIGSAMNDISHNLGAISDMALAYLLSVELWLREQMTAAGAPPAIQTAAMICAGAFVVMASTRAFGRLIRVAVVMLLVLTLVRIAIPGAEP